MVRIFGKKNQRFVISVEDLPWVERSGWRTIEDVVGNGANGLVALSSSSDVIRLPLDRALGGPSIVFVKRYSYTRRAQRIKQMFRGTVFGKHRARKEYEFLAAMRDRGVPTVRAIAHGEDRRWGAVWSSVLITEGTEGFKSFDLVALEHLRDGTLSRRDRISLTRGLALTIRQMHERGVRHGGLFWRNVLVRRVGGGEFEYLLLDPDSQGKLFPSVVPPSGVLGDLSEFVASAIALGVRGGLLLFLKTYFGVAKLTSSQRQFAAKILEGARSLARAEGERMAVTETIELLGKSVVAETPLDGSLADAGAIERFFEPGNSLSCKVGPVLGPTAKTILFVVAGVPGFDGPVRRSVRVDDGRASICSDHGTASDVAIHLSHDAFLAVVLGSEDALARLRSCGSRVVGDVRLLPAMIECLRRLCESSSTTAVVAPVEKDPMETHRTDASGTPAEKRAFGQKYKADDFAHYYSQKHKSSLMRRVSNYAERLMVRRALNRIRRQSEFRSVLDCPSGTGRFLPVLRDFDPVLITMDTSASMLREGQALFTSFAVSPKAIAGSAFELPLVDNAVDVVLCSRLLHHIPERENRVRILREFSRVASIGVVFSFFDANSFRAWRRRSKEARKGRAGGRHAMLRSECEAEAREAGLMPVGMTSLLRFHTEVTAAVCLCGTDGDVVRD